MPFESPDLGKLLFQIGSTLTAQRQQQEQINLKKQELDATMQARADALKMQEKTLKMRQEQFEISTQLQAGQQNINAQNAATAAANAATSQRELELKVEGKALQDQLTVAKIKELGQRHSGGGNSLSQMLTLNSRLHSFGTELAQSQKNLGWSQLVTDPSLDAETRNVISGFKTPKDMLTERVRLVHERDQNLVLGNATDDLPALKRINDQLAVMDKLRQSRPELFGEPTAEEITAALPPELQQAYGVLSTSKAGMEARSFHSQIEQRRESLQMGMEDLAKGNLGTLAAQMKELGTTGDALDREKLQILADTMSKDFGLTPGQFNDVLQLILGTKQ